MSLIAFSTVPAAANIPSPMPVPRASDGAGQSGPVATDAASPAGTPIAAAAAVPKARGPATSQSIPPSAAPAARIAASGSTSAPAIGAYIAGGAQDPSLLDSFESMTRAHMQIVTWYQPWGYTNGWYQPVLDTAALNTVAARSATPMITWEAWGSVNGVDPSHVANIPTGAFDTYIDSWAQGLKAFGKPVYLRLFHEMNNQGYPWAYGMNGNTAQDLIAAWRYVHDRFTRIGASNVLWVWGPNTENDLVSFSALYPGDGYVDWFGVDGYNGGTALDWGGWLSAQQIFDRSYRAFQALNAGKPIMIAETSSAEQGGSKAQWITDLLGQTLPQAFPAVRALVWFDEDFTAKGQTDWRVNTSQTSLAAFTASVTRL